MPPSLVATTDTTPHSHVKERTQHTAPTSMSSYHDENAASKWPREKALASRTSLTPSPSPEGPLAPYSSFQVAPLVMQSVLKNARRTTSFIYESNNTSFLHQTPPSTA